MQSVKLCLARVLLIRNMNVEGEHNCNLSTQEVEAKGPKFKVGLGRWLSA